ncbi:class A beta-lactamase-related serine hydrolase [Microbacterium marinilacus]|uniref:Beta-lactamase class A catalytic domain-containing protein n=2 Tax=Microbacterium marinilacus TaxID=415209 RepID=A0ABP7BX34_9MICO|nr:class A beta-lactamase-related serine hydrolase [Microbacterium marinilacus]
MKVRHGTRRDARRGRGRQTRTFRATTRALEELSLAGAQVAVHVAELDRGEVVLEGDDHVPLPVGGLGTVPLLVEAAALIEDGALDPLELVDRPDGETLAPAGPWRGMAAPTLPLIDLALLAGAYGDSAAANTLLERVGHEAVTRRYVDLGMPRSALLDGFRAERGPDDAPYVALGTAREFAALFAALAAGEVVSTPVSERVVGWLSPVGDVGLVGATVGGDPFSHTPDGHGLVHFAKTGRERGVRADAGVVAGRRGAFAYALIVAFDDLSLLHRHRAHAAFHALGGDLLEYAT